MTDEVKTYTEEEVAAMLEKETSGLKAKVDELLGESKTAKQKARELEEAQALAEEAAAKERGEFRELFEKERKEKAELSDKFNAFQDQLKKEKINGAASELASSLTRDTKRAKMLTEKIAGMAQYSDEGVTFALGGVEIDTDKLKAYVSDEYPFLIDGSGASGGGAAGQNKGGGAAKAGNIAGSNDERAAYFKDKFKL